MSSAELYTIEECAQRLRVKSGTLREWVNSGRVKSIRLGPRTVRIRGDTIEEILNRGVTEPSVRARRSA
jgi:excisionase family DNA binding protein